MEYFVLYLCIVNALGFLLMLADKKKAVKKHWRIPESALIGIAILGGSLGSLLGMYTCRHKTRKPQFAVGIPLILTLQVTAILFYLQ